MRLEEAVRRLRDAHSDYSRFYGQPLELDWGVGVLGRNLTYPLFDSASADFILAEGVAYVVSHECDIDQENDRPFNNAVLVCPVIPFEAALDHLNSHRTPSQVRGFIDALSNNTVDRVIYIPALPDALPWGGLLYFNAMSHTDVSEVEKIGNYILYLARPDSLWRGPAMST